MEKSISVEEFVSNVDQVMLLDVRRKEDFEDAEFKVSGAIWKDPACIEEWIDWVPENKEIVIYCARGGGVSSNIVDRMIVAGRNARFISGGIAALEGNDTILVKK